MAINIGELQGFVALIDHSTKPATIVTGSRDHFWNRSNPLEADVARIERSEIRERPGAAVLCGFKGWSPDFAALNPGYVSAGQPGMGALGDCAAKGGPGFFFVQSGLRVGRSAGHACVR
jgi:hypothetical protein